MVKKLLTLLFTFVLAFPLSTLALRRRLPPRTRPRRKRAGRGML